MFVSFISNICSLEPNQDLNLKDVSSLVSLRDTMKNSGTLTTYDAQRYGITNGNMTTIDISGAAGPEIIMP